MTAPIKPSALRVRRSYISTGKPAANALALFPEERRVKRKGNQVCRCLHLPAGVIPAKVNLNSAHVMVQPYYKKP